MDMLSRSAMKSRIRRRLGLFWAALLAVSAGVILPAAARKAAEWRFRRLASPLRPFFQTFAGTSWSEEHPEESGHTFDDFQAAAPDEIADPANPICVLPLGELSPAESAAMETTAEFLGIFFNRPVRRLPADTLRDLPDSARRTHPRWGDKQVLASHLLWRRVKPAAPPNALATLGFTMTDLWPGKGWNFVFGLARPASRVGVHSFHRYGDPNGNAAARREFLLRSLKVAAHETGHLYGIPHCVAYHCCMNGVNNVEELDRIPLLYCPECSAKLWWANRIEPGPWFEGLDAFLRRTGLEAQADRCRELGEGFR